MAKSDSEQALIKVKSIFLSKTFWINIIAVLALQVQKHYGFVIEEELQLQLLGLVNIALRMVTKEPVTWRKNGNTKKNS